MGSSSAKNVKSVPKSLAMCALLLHLGSTSVSLESMFLGSYNLGMLILDEVPPLFLYLKGNLTLKKSASIDSIITLLLIS